MTEQHETFVPAGAIAASDPEYFDVWHNPLDQDMIVSVHENHDGGPTRLARDEDGKPQQVKTPKTTYFRIVAHMDARIPKEFRRVVQTYLCESPECRGRPGSKICLKDHPAKIVGGQAPMAIRKNAPHIHPNAIFSPEFVENSVPANGAVPGKSGGDNAKELQPRLEKLWQKTTREPFVDPSAPRAVAKTAPAKE